MVKQLLPAIRATLVLATFSGIFFPFVMTAIAQVVFPFQANGSLIRDNQGQVIGSQILAQQFTAAEYFHPRPSAAGSGYAGEASGGSNLGPTSKKLIDGVKESATAYRIENGLTENAKVPVDAVTKSGSGLDPHISVENALLQARRVAKARSMSYEQLVDLVKHHMEGRDLGILGEPRVNVLMLNLTLSKMKST